MSALISFFFHPLQFISLILAKYGLLADLVSSSLIMVTFKVVLVLFSVLFPFFVGEAMVHMNLGG